MTWTRRSSILTLFRRLTTKLGYHMNIDCQYCGTTFSADWAGRKYCSKSCSAKVNNTLYPKRVSVKQYCLMCGEEFTSIGQSRQKCPACISATKSAEYIWKVTMGEYKNGFSRAAQAYNSARTISRRIYEKSDRPKSCLICRYAKHYEVCHIEDLQHVPDDKILGLALSHQNIVALCPNHHWEFDKGLL